MRRRSGDPRSALRTLALLASLVLLGSGCGGCGKQQPRAALPACDAGDQAWARRAIPLLLGRPPTGITEVRVVADLAHEIGRAAAAETLMRRPEYLERWSDWLLDEVQVNRAGERANEACYGAPLGPDDEGELARKVRNAPPLEGGPTRPFNMRDLARSSIALDDPTPFFRAQLFGMLARPVPFCPNISDEDNERARRRHFGDLFMRVYAHRNMECLACHNSERSVTRRSDPEKNRFFEVPGHFEKALFEQSRGRTVEEAFAAFRFGGVVSSGDPTAPPRRVVMLEGEGARRRPWNIDAACGTFAEKAAMQPDPHGAEGFLGAALGRTASVWDVEHLLGEGIERLRRGERPAPGDVAAPVAAGYLLAMRIAHQAWEEAFGAALTLAHDFPRHAAQRDTLIALTETLLSSGWSMRALLGSLVTHPLFNPKAPEEGCGEGPYDMPPLFDAWTYLDPDETRRGNGTGDQIHRADGRALLKGTAAALGWSLPAEFPDAREAVFQSSVGVFVSEGRGGAPGTSYQGLLAWERRLGTCRPPPRLRRDPEGAGSDPRSCRGRCGHGGEGPRGEEACWCDAGCAAFGDCCADVEQACVAEEQSPDWIDDLARTAAGWSGPQPLRVRDAAVALKDRLLAIPALSSEEERLVEAVFGVPLDAPLDADAAWAEGARRYCGVLLKSPQFQLRGLLPGEAATPDPPRLLTPASTYRALCESYETSARRTGLSLACRDEALSVRRRWW